MALLGLCLLYHLACLSPSLPLSLSLHILDGFCVHPPPLSKYTFIPVCARVHALDTRTCGCTHANWRVGVKSRPKRSPLLENCPRFSRLFFSSSSSSFEFFWEVVDFEMKREILNRFSTRFILFDFLLFLFLPISYLFGGLFFFRN